MWIGGGYSPGATPATAVQEIYVGEAFEDVSDARAAELFGMLVDTARSTS